MAMQGWSDGPLYTILTCLSSFVDFVAFSSVCRSWRAVASSLSASRITSLFPPLLHCSPFTQLHQSCILRLLSPTSPSLNNSLSCSFGKLVSVSFGFLCSHGRLFRLSNNRVVILNPFTGDELYSPILPQDRPYRLEFPLHSSTVSFIGSDLFLFTSRTLFHWHIGSPSWACPSPRIKPRPKLPVNVTTVKGKVYAIDYFETLFVVDLSPQLRLRKLEVDRIGTKRFNFCYQRFLVYCGGELLLLRLLSTQAGYKLKALQLDLSAKGAIWMMKESIGNWAIFIGYDPKIPGLAVENPERWGGQSNCVYFATGDSDCPWGVVKLGEKIGEYSTKSPRSSTEGYSRKMLSVWVHPGF